MYATFVRIAEFSNFCKCSIKSFYVKFKSFSVGKKRKFIKHLIDKHTSCEGKKLIFYSNEIPEGKDYLFALDFGVNEPMMFDINYKTIDNAIFFHVKNGKPNKDIYVKMIIALSMAFKYQLQPISLAKPIGENELTLILEPIEEAIEKFELVNPKEKENEEVEK